MKKMKKVKNKKDLDYYLSLPWTYTIETETHEGSSYFIIRVNESPGICTDSESLDEGIETGIAPGYKFKPFGLILSSLS